VKYDLLPCPFCANNAAEIHYTIPAVWCSQCGCTGPYPATTGDEREAVTLWNTRRDTEPDTDE
jgi:hypothetical protein